MKRLPPILVLSADAPPRRKYAKRRTPLFTPAEEELLRAAIEAVHARHGTWALAGAALGVAAVTLRATAAGTLAASGDTAIRVARDLGVPLDALLAPSPDGSTCRPRGES